MKLKVMAQVTVLLVLSACIAQAASTITVIGRHPFHQPPLESADDLREMMLEQQMEVEEGLEEAGYPELIEPLNEQFSDAEIQEIKYEPYTTFQWMFFKRNGRGKVRVAQDLTWGGDDALPGYEFFIDKECERYTFAVPAKCGNLALLKVEDIEGCPAATATCKECFTTCTECKENGEDCPAGCSECYTIEEDCCATCRAKCSAECKENPDTPGCAPECAICPDDCLQPPPEPPVKPSPTCEECFTDCKDNPEGSLVNCEECPAKEADCCEECRQDCSAECKDDPYAKGCPAKCQSCPNECLPAAATCEDCSEECLDDPYGKGCPEICGTEECRPTTSTALRFIGDLGYLRLSDPADYAFGRIGVEYSPFIGSGFEDISFLAMIGAAPKVQGSDGDDALLVDAFAQYNWSGEFDGWIGLGVGGWITSGDVDDDSGDTDIDILANIGARIYGDPEDFNVSLFLEARNAVDELDSISQYGRFGIGLRFKL